VVLFIDLVLMKPQVGLRDASFFCVRCGAGGTNC